eukprot:CAMPEP_0205915938 /NCGR_PEP_ID=MMETSP1325-20131115/8190_1 /ASSEMBLY_ACC=CAM_ASM_000708 /TAXON_ID=236786 /ORGANISM="Florenciella sp., Strain RCC1007" /LENGTH=36 /DNA_ID= /DNA_START= /DNA_END= /DNA_ORIENTATION=
MSSSSSSFCLAAAVSSSLSELSSKVPDCITSLGSGS